METSEGFPDNKTNLADPEKLAEENPKSCQRSTRGQTMRVKIIFLQERIKGTEKASPIHTLFHR